MHRAPRCVPCSRFWAACWPRSVFRSSYGRARFCSSFRACYWVDAPRRFRVGRHGFAQNRVASPRHLACARSSDNSRHRVVRRQDVASHGRKQFLVAELAGCPTPVFVFPGGHETSLREAAAIANGRIPARHAAGWDRRTRRRCHLCSGVNAVVRRLADIALGGRVHRSCFAPCVDYGRACEQRGGHGCLSCWCCGHLGLGGRNHGPASRSRRTSAGSAGRANMARGPRIGHPCCGRTLWFSH